MNKNKQKNFLKRYIGKILINKNPIKLPNNPIKTNKIRGFISTNLFFTWNMDEKIAINIKNINLKNCEYI